MRIRGSREQWRILLRRRTNFRRFLAALLSAGTSSRPLVVAGQRGHAQDLFLRCVNPLSQYQYKTVETKQEVLDGKFRLDDAWFTHRHVPLFPRRTDLEELAKKGRSWGARNVWRTSSQVEWDISTIAGVKLHLDEVTAVVYEAVRIEWHPEWVALDVVCPSSLRIGSVAKALAKEKARWEQEKRVAIKEDHIRTAVLYAANLRPSLRPPIHNVLAYCESTVDGKVVPFAKVMFPTSFEHCSQCNRARLLWKDLNAKRVEQADKLLKTSRFAECVTLKHYRYTAQKSLEQLRDP